MTFQDPIYDVFWEGPHAWAKRRSAVRPHHVLYAIHGTHLVYGASVPLYIGKTHRVAGKRLDEHDWWVKDECEDVAIRIASIGPFSNWKRWNQLEAYPKAEADLVTKIEALLIHANQPAYNSQGKQSLNVSEHFRVINSGNFGRLLPEASTRYYED